MLGQMPQFESSKKEIPSAEVVEQEKVQGIGASLDFIEKMYFHDFLNKLDELEKTVNFAEVEAVLDIDLEKMRNYIDVKIPYLFEEIQLMANKEQIAFAEFNSLKDVLGNSIIAIFNKILWVLENFHNADPVVQEKIANPQSVTRKIISLYSKHEGKDGLASYYIDSLCADSKKLKMEIITEKGFLQNYRKYFNNIIMDNGKISSYYPSGGKKLPYFKFFNELENGNINTVNIEKALTELDEKIVNMDEIRKSEKVQQVQ